MSDEIKSDGLLSDVRFTEYVGSEPVPIVSCPYHEIDECLRLYYRPSEHKADYPGGVFMLVDWAGGGNGPGDVFGGDPEVNVVFHGWATFEGVRHIWWSPKDDGYLYYPDIQGIAAALVKVTEVFPEAPYG